MTHHLLPDIDRAALAALQPRLPGPRPGAGADVVRQGPRGADAGGPRAAAAGGAVRDVRRPGRRRRRRAARPAATLGAALRRARASTSTRRCCPGRPGRATPTASGRRTGTPASRPRPASRRTPPARATRCPTGWQPLLERCRPYYDALAPYRLAPARRPDAAEVRRAQPRPGRRDRRPLVHRDQAGISPFDSVVQGGDAVWEGLRLHGGRIFKLDRAPGPAAALGARRWRSRRSRPTRRSSSGSGPSLAANAMTDDVHIRLTLTRGVKITSGMDPRLNQSGPDADRAGGVQVAGLRRQRDLAGHLVGAPAPPGLARPEDPPQQPAHLDPGQDRGQRRRRRRRADARRRRVRGRDQRDARLPRRRTTSSAPRPRAPAPRASPARRSSRSARRPGIADRGRRLLADRRSTPPTRCS